MADETTEGVAAFLGSKGLAQQLDNVNSIVGSLDNRMDAFDGRLGTMSAHLENIARESAKTTEVLEQERRDRKEREEHARAVELRKIDRKDEIEDDNRAKIAKVGAEVWDLFKKPLAYLLTGVFGYILFTYFGVGG